MTQKNNLAYDYNRLARREEAEKQPQIHEVRTKRRAAKKEKLSVARCVAVMVVVVLMLSALLYARVVQIEVANEYNQTASTLSALKAFDFQRGGNRKGYAGNGESGQPSDTIYYV